MHDFQGDSNLMSQPLLCNYAKEQWPLVISDFRKSSCRHSKKL